MKIEFVDNKLVEVTADAHELFANAAKEKSAYPFQNSDNNAQYYKLLKEDNDGFSGGTYESLFLSPDMTPFKLAKEKLAQSELTKRISQKLTNINRRRRKLSEHDGEWSIERKWEVEPFYNAKRVLTNNRILEIEVHVNVAAQVSAQQIADFGQMVWGINDIVESCGINTQITMFSRSMRTDRDSSIDVQVCTILKRPGEYVNPLNIAKCLTPNFLRRIIFDWFIIGCDFAGKTAGYGLGRPYEHRDIVRFENGKLVITSEAIRLCNSVQIQNEVVKAIMGDK